MGENRTRRREDLASELSALVRLREANDRLWQSHDLTEGLEQMLDAGIELLGADMGSIRLLNPARQVLEIAVQRGLGPDFLESFHEVSAADDRAFGRSLRMRERILIEDMEADPDFAPCRSIAAAAGYRAVQSTPLLARDGQPAGMFSTFFRKPHRPSGDELRWFDLYARQTTDFIERVASEQQRHRGEATVQALMETAAEAILAIGKDGRIALANAAAEKMFGYSRDLLVGQFLEKLLPERYRASHARHREAWFADPHNRPMGIGFDLAGVRKDGSEFPIEVSLSYAGAKQEMLGVAFVSDITERKKHEQTILEYKDRLQQLTRVLISAQEAANREVARELHDVFSQELAVVAMEVSLLKEKLSGNREASARLSELGDRIVRLSSSLHETSRELHPGILEQLGLELALRHECGSFQQRTLIATHFDANGVPPDLPANVSLCLYRVAQESLRNVHRHSQSATVLVQLLGFKNEIILRVRDAPGGFDVGSALKKGGLGLISMEERVRLVNGKLTIESAPGQGTIVTASVPL